MSRQGQWQPRTQRNVKAFWTNEATEWGDNPRVTIRDHYFRLLCMQTISAHIKGSRRLLDVGCGSGFGTLFYATLAELAVGADYAMPMVQNALRLFSDPAYRKSVLDEYAFAKEVQVHNNVVLQVGDITNLVFPEKFFDAVVCERIIVNLTRRAAQNKAVAEVGRVLDRSGTAAIAEASVQGHQNIDRIRNGFGLAPMEKYWHNLYIDEPAFIDECAKNGLTLESTVRFETYQFLSKVVYPRVIAPEEPDFLSGFNLAAHNVCGEFPSYDRVASVGTATFLREIFVSELRRHDPSLAERTGKVVGTGIFDDVNFAKCSHQVLFVLKKS